jgi:hypothetical protein
VIVQEKIRYFNFLAGIKSLTLDQLIPLVKPEKKQVRTQPPVTFNQEPVLVKPNKILEKN